MYKLNQTVFINGYENEEDTWNIPGVVIVPAGTLDVVKVMFWNNVGDLVTESIPKACLSVLPKEIKYSVVYDQDGGDPVQFAFDEKHLRTVIAELYALKENAKIIKINKIA